jgi:acetate kinase
MNILILKPSRGNLEYIYFLSSLRIPIIKGTKKIKNSQSFSEELRMIFKECGKKDKGRNPAAVVIYGNYGGELFREPELINQGTIKKLEKLIEDAPVHIPTIIELAKIFVDDDFDIPVLLLFGSSFFVNLPEREILYGVNTRNIKCRNIRRFGFHGLFHESACYYAIKKRNHDNKIEPVKILSICLESHPEVAAVKGMIPIMVTGGSTPLEGLPGNTSCGEIDPAIPLVMSQNYGYGPEELNNIFADKSGISALAGEKTTIENVLISSDKKYELAKNVLEYRIFLACGAGIAAMDGVDSIVFSGRYIKAAIELAASLLATPFFQEMMSGKNIDVQFFEESINCLIAERALVKAVELRAVSRCC